MRKTLKEAISTVAVIALLSPLLVCLVAPFFVGGFFSVVMSGSMEPTIPVGSIVVVGTVNPEDVKVGDVIAFRTGESRIIHRVIDRVVEDGSIYFKTKGDANEEPDPWLVRPQDICGVVILTVPYYGYLIYFAQTPLGFTLMVIVPAILIIAGEVRSILMHRREGDKK
ncbi:signal peptidase I [Candidatus Bathyarchaeota archaeon]|nr:signal peptidase I [Candidatus Bathyarchaeota archaeon]